MSDTPRTDALQGKGNDGEEQVWDFARQLERELAAEKARLDWIAEQQVRETKAMELHHKGEILILAWDSNGQCNPIIYKGSDYREAIDLARKTNP